MLEFLIFTALFASAFVVISFIDAITSGPYFFVDTVFLKLAQCLKLLFFFKRSRWKIKPQWKIEFFGEHSKATLRQCKIECKEVGYWYSTFPSDSALHVHTTPEWEWIEKNKTFSSERKAMSDFKKSDTFKSVPYVEFRSKCVNPGVTKNKARQQELEKRSTARIEYKEKYIEHLESELAKMRGNDN